MMPTVQLDEQEWQLLMAILAKQPWDVANPLLMKIGNQLRQQPTNAMKGSSLDPHNPAAH